MNNIMDGQFNGMASSEFYRAQVFPELFPHEKPMLINNWPQDDLQMYCGVSPKNKTYLEVEGKDG